MTVTELTDGDGKPVEAARHAQEILEGMLAVRAEEVSAEAVIAGRLAFTTVGV